MLSKAQEKLVRSTHTKKGREKSGLVLLEGETLIKESGMLLQFTFKESDTPRFRELVTTYTPQMRAGVARVPDWTLEDVARKHTVVILDHVQDPGNVGTILRSCLGFDAGLVLVDSADPTNPKVVRSSVGALFHAPWIVVKPSDLPDVLKRLNRSVYRLERAKRALSPSHIPTTPCVVVAGSEGTGITLPIDGPSVEIAHNKKLESLNVATAVSLVLAERYNQ